jgi:hypothetical protein
MAPVDGVVAPRRTDALRGRDDPVPHARGSHDDRVAVSVHPGRVLDFDRFRTSHPAAALALDGYVEGPSRWDWDGPWGTLDHHAGVERLRTGASCEQTAAAVRLGLWDRLGPGRTLQVHLNDCDADTCLSVWLLRHPDRIAEPPVRALVRWEGSLDAHGGCALGLVPERYLPHLAWVFEPYVCWREDPGADLGPDTQLRVIDEVGGRIDAWADGRAREIDDDSGYEVLRRTEHAVAVAEHGPYARLALQADGRSCFVAVRRHGGRTVMTIGRVDDDVPLDLLGVWSELNELEGREPDHDDRWGGGDLIGGSPRRSGTLLDVDRVCEVVEHHVH